MTIWPALLQVLGLSAAFFPPASPQGVTGSNDLTFPGASCQLGFGAHCYAEAVCDTPGHCKCLSSGSDGTMFCVRNPDEQYVELVGLHNELQGWNNSMVAPMNLECRTRLTEIKTERTSENRKCTFQIFGENKVLNDKVVLHSLEMHLRIEVEGQVSYEAAYKISPGTLVNDHYSYLQYKKPIFQQEQAETFTDLPDNDQINSGSGMGEFFDDEDHEEGGNPSQDDEDSSDDWGTPTTLGTTQQDDGVVSQAVDGNSVAITTVAQCGLEMRFRAADPALINHGLGPGMAIVVDPEHYNIQFIDPNSYLTGSPLLDSHHALRSMYHATQTMIYLHTALKFAAVQSDDDHGETCKDTAFVYRAYCKDDGDKMKALFKCLPFLTDWDKRFCIYHNSPVHDSPLHLFKRCMWISCEPKGTVCNMFRNEFDAEVCLDQSEKDHIFEGCPPTS